MPVSKSVCVAFLMVCAAVTSVHAADRQDGAATSFIAGLGDQFVSALKAAPKSDTRRDRLRMVFDQALDYPTIAEFTLGRYWDKTSAALRTEYVAVFRRYVVEVYTGQLGKFLGQTYHVIEERSGGEDTTIVTVEIAHPDARKFLIDFRVGPSDDGLKVIDIAVDGVSLMVAKRAEFRSVVRREGVDGLIERLRRITERIAAPARKDASRPG